MRFIVRRTSSSWRELDRPCQEAVKGPYLRQDERIVNKPEKISMYAKNPQAWYDEGINHRVVKGHIIRDFPAEAWFIDINTLEELLAFRQKYGSLVIERHLHNPDYLCLEIYDNYRE